jgi:hypothetical protein
VKGTLWLSIANSSSWQQGKELFKLKKISEALGGHCGFEISKVFWDIWYLQNPC